MDHKRRLTATVRFRCIPPRKGQLNVRFVDFAKMSQDCHLIVA